MVLLVSRWEYIMKSNGMIEVCVHHVKVKKGKIYIFYIFFHRNINESNIFITKLRFNFSLRSMSNKAKLYIESHPCISLSYSFCVSILRMIWRTWLRGISASSSRSSLSSSCSSLFSLIPYSVSSGGSSYQNVK